mgnify:CR=1 FL=1
MKWDFKIMVLIVEWSYFRGGLEAGFYCTYIDFDKIANKNHIIYRLINWGKQKKPHALWTKQQH